jgi:hypothetical protein
MGAGIGDDITPETGCVGAVDKGNAGLCGRLLFKRPLKLRIGNAYGVCFGRNPGRMYGRATDNHFLGRMIDRCLYLIDHVSISKRPRGVNDNIKQKMKSG